MARLRGAPSPLAVCGLSFEPLAAPLVGRGACPPPTSSCRALPWAGLARGSKEARESKRQADAQATGGKEAAAENVRETEIMTLFAKGRNLAYIQEQLCLSKSTVSTHRQHIYQKLGVHSSQEMIDLIQEEKA